MPTQAGASVHSGHLQQRDQQIQQGPPRGSGSSHQRGPSISILQSPEPETAQPFASPGVLTNPSRNIHFEQSPSPVPFPSLTTPKSSRRISMNFTRRPRMGTFGSSGSIKLSRPRGKSWSEHTQDVAHQLAPPVIVPLVILCLLWYLSSAVSNNLSKSILDKFEYPVSLTLLQFVYASGFAALFTKIASQSFWLESKFPANTFSGTFKISKPSSQVFRATAPMAAFQLVGHLLSYSAMSQIPVSLVHAIKSLSPLFTVAVTSFLGQRYNNFTYGSMVPLTLGVMMTCAAEFRAQPLALIYALLATLIFVAQNLYSKQLLSSDNASQKPAKMTVLGWCAAFAFAANLPIWFASDGYHFWRSGVNCKCSWITLAWLFTLNGFSHFCQNLLSFLVLGAITPVAFSIASLLKRIVVITVAILWFGQRVTASQGWGILISFFGLYVYDRFGEKVSQQELPR